MRSALPAAFLVVVLLLAGISFAYFSSNLDHRTDLLIENRNGTNYTIHITYYNYSYYSQPNLGVQPVPGQSPDPNMDTGEHEAVLTVKPLEGAKIYVSLNGYNISENGVSASCNPMITDSGGRASCSINFYIDSSGSVHSVSDMVGCGTLAFIFHGGSMGSEVFKPSSVQTMVCAKASPAIAALPPAIYNTLSKPEHIVFCFPVMLVAGLLIASMYYSGKDPLSLFDLTTPRLPKGKQSRVTGGKIGIAPRTAAERYRQIKQNSRTQSAKTLNDIMNRRGANKAQKKEAQKSLKRIFDELDQKLKKQGKKADAKTLTEYQEKVLALLNKYMPDDAGAKMRFGSHVGLITSAVELYVFSDYASKQMAEGMATAKGGPLSRFRTGYLDKASNLLSKFEKSKVGRVLKRIPGVGYLTVKAPQMWIESHAIMHTSRRFIQATERRAIGQVMHDLVFTRKKKGERVDTAAGRAMRKMFSKDKLENTKNKFGKFFNWYTNKWNYDDFAERHNVLGISLSSLYNAPESYRILTSHELNYSKYVLHLIGAISDKNWEKILEEKIKNAKTKAEREELEGIRDALRTKDLHALHQAYEKLATKLSGDDKKDLETYNKVLKAVIDSKDKTSISDQMEVILRAQGIKIDGKLKDGLGELKRQEKEIAEKFGLVFSDGHYEVASYEYFMKLKLQSADEARRKGGSEQEIFISKVNAMRAFAGKGDELFEIMSMDEKKSTAEYSKRILPLYTKHVMDAIDAEVKDKDGKRAMNGGASKLKETLNTIASEIDAAQKEIRKASGKAAPAEPVVGMGNDVAGTIAMHSVKATVEILRKAGHLNEEELKIIEKMMSITSINDFEVALARGYGSKTFTAILSRAIAKAYAEGDTKTLAAIASLLAIPDTAVGGSPTSGMMPTTADKIQKALEQTAKFRGMLLNAVESLDPKSLGKLYKLFGLQPSSATDRKAQIEELVERIHLLDATVDTKTGKITGPDKKAYIEAAKLLKLDPREHVNIMQKSSISEKLFTQMSEKMLHDTLAWSASAMRSVSLISGDAGTWAKNTSVKEFARVLAQERAGIHDQMEYTMDRKKMMFTQYQGTNGMHIEGLLFSARAINRALEFEISKPLKGALGHESVAGTMMGFYKPFFKNILDAYETQKAMYQNLVNKDSALYDSKFAKGNNSEFDVNGYLALQKRGILYGDHKRGLAYIQSSEATGAIPLLEFNKQVLDQQGKGIIVKNTKEDERDYASLLSRLNISNYAGTVIGIVAVENTGKTTPDGKTTTSWKRFDPLHRSEISAIHNAAMKDTLHKDELTSVLAGLSSGGASTMRFITGRDYVNNHQGKYGLVGKTKIGVVGPAFQKAMTAGGEFALGVFHEPIRGLRTWYAAQARLRDSLYRFDAMTKEATVFGTDRRVASKYLKEAGNAAFLSYNDLMEVDERRRRTKEAGEKEAEGGEKAKDEKGKKNPVDTLRQLVEALEKTDVRTAHLRTQFSRLDSEGAKAESALYTANLELKALRMMQKKGLLDDLTSDQYKALEQKVKSGIKDRSSEFEQVKRENEGYRQAVISLTGSHANTNYGSSRTLFGIYVAPLFAPERRFVTGLKAEASVSLESSSMRDTGIAMGMQKGMEYGTAMRYDTGQGMYENPRWWAAMAFEKSMVPGMTAAHFLHRIFLPYSSVAYRDMIGLSSYLQATELDSARWNKPRYARAALTLFGLRRGVNDFGSATTQDFIDISGLGNRLAAMRSRGKVHISQDGEVYVTHNDIRSKFSSKIATESSHVSASAQIGPQQRPLDKIATSKAWSEWKDNPSIHDLVNKWMSAKVDYDYAENDKERSKYDAKLKEYEEQLSPYAHKITDSRAEINVGSRGAGNYFNKDGSRDRFVNAFMAYHSNMWKQVIPGMTETSPDGRTFLSTPTVALLDRAAPESRLSAMKYTSAYRYNEAEKDFVLNFTTTPHVDAYRQNYRLDTPALLHIMKVQSYEKKYEWFRPWTHYLEMIPGYSEASHFVQHRTERIKRAGGTKYATDSDAATLESGLGAAGYAPFGGIRGLNNLSSLDANNWDEIGMGQAARRGWAARKLHSIAELSLERSRKLSLEATENKRNTEEMRRQLALLGLGDWY